MNESINRLLIVMAGIGFSDEELYSIISDLRKMSPDSLIDRISGIQKIALLNFAKTDNKARLNSRKGVTFNIDDSVGMRVERLLKSEAKLPTQQAADILRFKMIEDGLGTESTIPRLYKKSLSIWVDRIVKKIPPKEILRCATLIRNEWVHKPSSDWVVAGEMEW